MDTKQMTEEKCLKKGNHKVWKFVTEEDFTWKTTILKGRECNFEWLKISKDGTITVKGTNNKGYAWDGCTPKWNFFHVTWGNFDGKLKKFESGNYKPYTYYASMVHDVLYQYKRCAPITRKEADIIFYEILKKSEFMWSSVFFAGVRLFGWWFKGWNYRSK